jgi:creatinine amidohydrolase/Fe(II)-dependent formamide hydrolase-like protein
MQPAAAIRSTLMLSGILFAQQSPDLSAPRPIDSLDTVFTEEMTWMEVRDAIAAGKTTVIVGTGGLEQNGPHVATGKHNFVLRSTTAAIARKLGNALVAPIVPFVPEGQIDPPTGHMRYPGSIGLRDETFRALLTDICASLKQSGFRDIVLIGDSGGNLEGMQAVADALNREWAFGPTRVHHIPEYYQQDIWSYDELKRMGIVQLPDVKSASRAGVHTDFHYESIVALVDPRLIRMDQRIKSGRFEVNGVELAPIEKTLEAARHLVDYRAYITVAAIRKALSARPSR